MLHKDEKLETGERETNATRSWDEVYNTIYTEREKEKEGELKGNDRCG